MEKTAIKFLAQNKYLLVEVIEENQQGESPVAVPEDYKRPENPFKLGVILDAEPNSSFYEHLGSYVLFPSNSLEKIEVQGLTVKMVPSHAVYGVLKSVEVPSQE